MAGSPVFELRAGSESIFRAVQAIVEVESDNESWAFEEGSASNELLISASLNSEPANVMVSTNNYQYLFTIQRSALNHDNLIEVIPILIVNTVQNDEVESIEEGGFVSEHEYSPWEYGAFINARSKDSGVQPKSVSSHKIARGDSLFKIASEYKLPEHSMSQYSAAIFSGNSHAFVNNDPKLLIVGEQLTLPEDAEVRRAASIASHYLEEGLQDQLDGGQNIISVLRDKAERLGEEDRKNEKENHDLKERMSYLQNQLKNANQVLGDS